MNKFNPNIHHRRSIRLKGYDYSRAGFYFITICCQNRICRFGHVENGEMILNEYGQIVCDEWLKLSERFPNFELNVLLFSKPKMKQWVNYGNAITTNTLYETNNRIIEFQNTL